MPGGAASGGGKKKPWLRRFAVRDRAVARRWERLALPAKLDRFLVGFMRVGDGWGWAVVAGALSLAQPWPRFRDIVGQSLMAVAVSIPMYWALKLGCRRIRPFAFRKSNVPRVPPLDRYSFPSGHTMNNLAVAMTLALYIPVLWPFALAIPVLLGLLRVMYGVHYVTDIAGGALLGAFSALAAHGLFPRIFS